MANPSTLTATVIPTGPCPINLSGQGLFYIGDPCYVFPKARWDQFCDTLFPDGDISYGRSQALLFIDAENDGGQFIVQSTAHGDGEYPVYRGERIGSFGVDAGLFSVIPMSLIEKWGDEAVAEAKRLGVIISLEDGKLSAGNGVLNIGQLRIDTLCDECDDEGF